MRRYGSLKGNPEQPRVAEFLNNVIRFPWREKAPDLIPGARVFPGPVLAEARQKVLAAVRASLDESHSGLEEAKSESLQKSASQTRAIFEDVRRLFNYIRRTAKHKPDANYKNNCYNDCLREP
jgi:hypothetical protein